MNRAATEDVRSPVWPVVSKVLHTGPAPSARDQKVVDLLDDWVAPRRAAPRRRQRRQATTRPGPAIMDARLAADRRSRDGAVSSASLLEDVNSVRGLGGLAGESYVDKDLRTLLGDRVEGPVQPELLRRGLAARLPRLALGAAARRRGRAGRAVRQPGSGHVAAAGEPTGFQPGLIPNTFRTTNRPTFQQVLEFQHQRRWRGWGG